LVSFNRIICVVLDGVGVGEAPDAERYGDTGSNSIGNTARAVGGINLPNLGRLGLGNILDVAGVAASDRARAHFGRLRPAAAGKDSTTGHWELTGCVLESPMPTYPGGFPDAIIDEFSARTGRGVLGNRQASGTQIIEQLGDVHVASGDLIVYTSQDSVFQIAAHEEVVPVDRLYEYCRVARELLVPPHGVGRVIARPFRGESGGYHRTPRRKDFSIAPPRDTALDLLSRAGKRVLTIGKIDDLFAGRGVDEAIHTADNRDGMRRTLEAVRHTNASFVFTNLVDFDTMWGHRNDARAYALGLEDFDSFLADLLPALRNDDLLVITSDHGNDPTTPSTDHSREEVPLLVYHGAVGVGRPLGVRDTFADVGATVCDALGVPPPEVGTSFLGDIS
jgi:phosphopentomutase